MTGTGIGGPCAAAPSVEPGNSINGIMLNPNPAADGSSVLQSTEMDIKLESGTRLEIGLVSAAQCPRSLSQYLLKEKGHPSRSKS